MPCNDHRSSVQIEYEDTPATKLEMARLKSRNDELMRTICAIDAWARPQMEYRKFLLENMPVLTVINEHRTADEDGWYKAYHDKYPNFNKTEIAKMVRSGILEDV